MNEIEIENCQRFAALARCGRHAGASSGEQAATRLADAVLSDIGSLDGQALDGLAAFLKAAKYAPETAAGQVANREPQ